MSTAALDRLIQQLAAGEQLGASLAGPPLPPLPPAANSSPSTSGYSSASEGSYSDNAGPFTGIWARFASRPSTLGPLVPRAPSPAPSAEELQLLEHILRERHEEAAREAEEQQRLQWQQEE